MKPTASFKMNKQTKKTAAKFIDPHERGTYLRTMVQAQLSMEDSKRQSISKKSKE